jgi:hypothetical protein
MTRRSRELLEGVDRRLAHLEHEAELLRTVFIVKEPDTGHAAAAYEGLRKQVIAGATARRSHLVQLAAMATAVRRATSLDDLVAQVAEWMAQAGVAEVTAVSAGVQPQDLFEDLDGAGLAGAEAIEVVEPAYVDVATGVAIRLGRARRASPAPAPAPAPPPPPSDPPPTEPALVEQIPAQEGT